MRFEENTVYHIYNRSYNKNRIFYKEENYAFFLNKLKTLKDLCEVFAYCLMPDHFHLLIYVPENSNATRLTAQSGLTGIQILSRKLGTILSSYTQAINKQEKRSIEDWIHSSFNEYYNNLEGICNKTLAVEILDIPAGSDLFYKQSYLVIDDFLIQTFLE